MPEESETVVDFPRFPEPNDDREARWKYGPYDDFFMTIRQWDEAKGDCDEIAGGLVSGVCTSQEHLRRGPGCSIQAIYLFHTASEPLRWFLFARKALMQQTKLHYARGFPRFRCILGTADIGRKSRWLFVSFRYLFQTSAVMLSAGWYNSEPQAQSQAV